LKNDHDQIAILHVHYAGKWVRTLRDRDRSVIKAINIRQTVPAEGSARPRLAYFTKNEDLDKWAEIHGKKVVVIPEGRGWAWEKSPTFAPEMHKLLTLAEKCTCEVRSIQSQPAGLGPSGSATKEALIIAVAEYESGQIKNLPNAVNDGSALTKALQVSNPRERPLGERGPPERERPPRERPPRE